MEGKLEVTFVEWMGPNGCGKMALSSILVRIEEGGLGIEVVETPSEVTPSEVGVWDIELDGGTVTEGRTPSELGDEGKVIGSDLSLCRIVATSKR